MDCMLPEMANSKIAREMRVGDPEYIMLAQEKQKKFKYIINHSDPRKD